MEVPVCGINPDPHDELYHLSTGGVLPYPVPPPFAVSTMGVPEQIVWLGGVIDVGCVGGLSTFTVTEEHGEKPQLFKQLT